MAQFLFTIPYGTEWQATVTLNYSVSYDAATNRSTVTFLQSAVSYPGRKGYGTSSATTITVSAGDNPASSGGASLATSGSSNPAGVTYYGTPGPAVTVQHSAGPGAKTVALSCSTDIGVYPFSGSANLYHITGGGSQSTVSVTIPDGSDIASVSSAAETLGAISLTMNRYDAAYWHRATFRAGETVLATSAAFETTLSCPVPRSWFSGFPTAESLTVTVSVQTYTDESCATPVGSAATAAVTVTADAGMAPVLQEGYAAAAPYNTGTPAAGITGFVSGLSRAELTLDGTKLDLSATAGASVSSIEVTGGGETATQSPYRTGVLSGTAVIRVTVTDSRGRAATQSLTVTCMDYAPPTLSAVSVVRCLSDGTESADGSCYKARATAGCASLNGQNSVTLVAQASQGSGGYGGAVTLASGAARIVAAGLDPDGKATVKLTATDALGGTAEAVVTLPGRRWALKFRADGEGAAFGKAPEYNRALELPAGWSLCFGELRLSADAAGLRLERLSGGAWTDVWSSAGS